MFRIKDPVWSHVHERPIPVIVGSGDGTHIREVSGLQEVSIGAIRAGRGWRVSSFPELVKCVAELGYRNRSYNLLFRGQSQDWKNTKGTSEVYPSICRRRENQKRLPTSHVIQRDLRLKECVRSLRELLQKDSVAGDLFLFDEYHVEILQHYEICLTPMVDVTQNLRVAASFALRGTPKGYVLVFGMPHPTGSISHVVDQNMVMVKLQSVCPPRALRPHFQEAYLVGRLPFTPEKAAGDNLARRLIGKYELDNSEGGFWERSVSAYPR